MQRTELSIQAVTSTTYVYDRLPSENLRCLFLLSLHLKAWPSVVLLKGLVQLLCVLCMRMLSQRKCGHNNAQATHLL